MQHDGQKATQPNQYSVSICNATYAVREVPIQVTLLALSLFHAETQLLYFVHVKLSLKFLNRMDTKQHLEFRAAW